MPRGGKLTTRRNALSSSGLAIQAQVGERVLDLLRARRSAGRRRRGRGCAAPNSACSSTRDCALERYSSAMSTRRDAFALRARRTSSTKARLVGVATRPRTRAAARPAPAAVHRFLPRRLRLLRDQRVGGIEDVAVRAVVLLQADHLRPWSTRARTRPCCRRWRRGRRRSTGRRRRPRTGAIPAPASSFSQRYCSRLVSWNSSTRMWRKRALVVLRAAFRCASAARSCAAAARRNRPRPRAGTARRRRR